MVQVPVRISGQGPLYNLSRELDAGWNLVSFADVMMVSADEAFRSIEGLWSYIIGYDAEKQRYAVPVTNGAYSRDALLDPRQGYWIFMNGTARMVGKQL